MNVWSLLQSLWPFLNGSKSCKWTLFFFFGNSMPYSGMFRSMLNTTQLQSIFRANYLLSSSFSLQSEYQITINCSILLHSLYNFYYIHISYIQFYIYQHTFSKLYFLHCIVYYSIYTFHCHSNYILYYNSISSYSNIYFTLLYTNVS